MFASCVALDGYARRAFAQPVEDNQWIFRGHEDAVSMAAFTPTGRSVVTGSFDKTVRIWDASKPLELRRFTQHTGPIFCLAVSGDGSVLATGAQDNTLRFWDLPLDRPISRQEKARSKLNTLAVSPDGKTLLSGGDLQFLRLDALGDDAPLSGLRVGHNTSITAVAFRRDGTFFASGDAAGRILFWSPYLSGVQAELIGQSTAVNQIAFTSNQQQLLTAGDDGHVRVWQLPSSTDQPIDVKNKIQIHDGVIKDMAMYAGGSHVVTIGEDRRIVMTNLSDGSETKTFSVPSTDLIPTALALRADNQRVAVGLSNGQVVVWNAKDGDEPVVQLNVDGSVTSIAYSRDHQFLAVATNTANIYLFGPSKSGVEPRQELALTPRQLMNATATVTDLAFHSDGQSVWGVTTEGDIDQWKIAAIEQKRQVNQGGAVYSVALSKDGKLAVACGSDQTVRVWETESGRQRAQLRGHRGAVHSVALSPDESLAVSSGADGTLRLWDIVGGRQLKQLIKLDATMYSVSVHPNGKWVAAAGADRKVYLLDLISGEKLHVLNGHSDYIHSVSFDPTGQRLLSYGYAGELRIWDPIDGNLLQETQVGKIGNSARFSPDGKRIVVANGDGTARIIYIATVETGSPVKTSD
ncbi:MAG: WD40 repeat domain-containing protein [Planctomycetota bacterium]